MTIITAEHLGKAYPVAVKQPGLRGTLSHFFRRRYRLIKAVERVSFQIEPGEVVGFLGPNGAGENHNLEDADGSDLSL